MSESVQLKYTDTELPDTGEAVTLFNSVTAGWPGRFAAQCGFKRLVVDIEHDQTISSFTFSKTPDRGTTWHVVETETTDITDPGAAETAPATTRREYNIEALEDFRLVMVNGAAAQTVFAVSMSVDREKRG